MAQRSSFEDYLREDSLETTVWIGKVVDNNDPTFSGRCKVRVYGKFDGTINMDDVTSNFTIPDKDLPWAYPAGSSIFAGGASFGAGSLSVPKVGSNVKIIFSGGNIYSPEYICVQDLNEKLKTEIQGSYQNATVIFYDEDEQVKVLYTQALGLEIFMKNSHITINPDSSITIEHKDSLSIVELIGPNINITANSSVNVTSNSRVNMQSSECILNGNDITKLGPSPTYSAVLSEPLWTFLKMMASAIDAKLPSTPGVMTTQAAAFERLSTSTNVKLSQ